MKGTIIAITICFFLSNQSIAQSLGDFRRMEATQKAKMLADSLKVVLNLSNSQYAQVYATMLSGANEANPIMNGNESRRSKRQKISAIGKQVETELKNELSIQQFALYQNKKDKLIGYYRSHFQSDKLLINVPD